MVVLNGMKGSQSWTTGNRLNFQPCKCTKIDVAIFKNIIFDLKFARDKILIGSFTPRNIEAVWFIIPFRTLLNAMMDLCSHEDGSNSPNLHAKQNDKI